MGTVLCGSGIVSAETRGVSSIVPGLAICSHTYLCMVVSPWRLVKVAVQFLAGNSPEM